MSRPSRKGLAQGRRVGHMGEHAQLDLAVVGADQRLARLSHEGLADLAALRRAHRNVLQVRILRGEAARRGRGQYVARMHAARVGVDIGGQRVGIGTFELGELPPVQGSSAAGRVPRPRVPRERAASVLQAPVLVLRPPGRLILSNRISPSCFGEPILKSSPASPRISSSRRAMVSNWSVWGQSRIGQRSITGT